MSNFNLRAVSMPKPAAIHPTASALVAPTGPSHRSPPAAGEARRGQVAETPATMLGALHLKTAAQAADLMEVDVGAATAVSTPITDDEAMMDALAAGGGKGRRPDTPVLPLAPLFHPASMKPTSSRQTAAAQRRGLRPLSMPETVREHATIQTPNKKARMADDVLSSPEPTLKDIMAKVSGTMDELVSQRAEMLNKLLAAKTFATEALDKAECAQEGVDDNRAAVARLDDKIERRERRSELVFRGIPLSGKEKAAELSALAVRLLTAVGLTAGELDVEYARVLPNSGLLLVRFATVSTRMCFFRRYLALPDGLWTTQLGYDEEDEEQVYAMDNLTAKNAQIRKRALALVKSGSLARLRIREGLVYVELTRGARQQAVLSVKELEDLVAPVETSVSSNARESHGDRGGAVRGGRSDLARGQQGGRGRGSDKGRGRGRGGQSGRGRQ